MLSIASSKATDRHHFYAPEAVLIYAGGRVWSSVEKRPRMTTTIRKRTAKAPNDVRGLDHAFEQEFHVSAERGFLPKPDPLPRLPVLFEVWEAVAAEMPKLL